MTQQVSCSGTVAGGEQAGFPQTNAEVGTLAVEFVVVRKQLRRAQMQQIQSIAAPDGLVAWTLANYGWRDFAYNWVAATQKASIENFFVACLDERSDISCLCQSSLCVLLTSSGIAPVVP